MKWIVLWSDPKSDRLRTVSVVFIQHVKEVL